MIARYALFASLLSAQSGGAPPLSPPVAITQQEIVVEGRILSRSDISKIVNSISNPEPIGGFDSQYARWSHRICVLVAGFPQNVGRFIADRIGTVASDLHLQPEGPGCEPNIFIIGTSNPTKLVTTLQIKRHGLVSGRDLHTTENFRKSPDPIRWIAAVTFTGQDGTAPRYQTIGGRTVASYQDYDASHIRSGVETYMDRETIVVDFNKIANVTYGQLSDYLTFIALGQINPRSKNTQAASILSLFSPDGDAPAGLTRFDIAYLKALYLSGPDLGGDLQQSEIISGIKHTLATPPPASQGAAPHRNP